MRRITLAALAVGSMFLLTACPLPEVNQRCYNPGEIQKRGSEIWKCREMVSETENGKPVSRWFQLYTPPAVIPSNTK